MSFNTDGIVNALTEVKRAKAKIVQQEALLVRFTDNLKFSIREIDEKKEEIRRKDNTIRQLRQRMNNIELNMGAVQLTNDNLTQELAICRRNLNDFTKRFLDRQPDNENILNRDLLQEVNAFL